MGKFDFIEDYFKKADLLPAIVQERSTGQVLMLAYMNRESMRKTFETGYVEQGRNIRTSAKGH